MSNINFTYTNLTPFKWYVLENFPFIEADFDALTNWQLFCKLGKEMNKIINSVNLSGEQVETLTKAFNDLQDYVNQYFSDLNVQEEVNNKLDELVQDGTLAQIINENIFNELNEKLNTNITNTNNNTNKLNDTNYIFNSVEEMKNSEVLENNFIVKTLGYYEKNDGGGAFYKIREITNQDIVNQMNIISLNTNENLIAELITSKEINVLQFGAKADNIYDNTSIFQTASNYAQNNNLKFYIPIGNYKTNTFTLENIKIIKIEGTINFFENTQFLNIYENVNGDTPNIFINKITVGTIIMKGLNSADITIQNAYKLRLVADNTTNHNFIGYTKFYLGFVRYLELWDDGSGNKWINENLFIGGRFLGITVDGTYSHHCNTFIKPMCENTVIDFKVGNQNRIIDARLEGNNTSITFASGTYGNTISSNYVSTIGNKYIPKNEYYQSFVTDNSGGKNRFYINENLIEEKVISLNAFNNPKNTPVTNGNLTPTTNDLMWETDFITLPTVNTCLYFSLSDPNVAFRLECYDESKNKLTTNPDLLINSPTIAYTSQGTYGNGLYTRNNYWLIMDSSNSEVKFIKLKIRRNTTSTPTIKNVDVYMTYYGKLENAGYYIEGFKHCITE